MADVNSKAPKPGMKLRKFMFDYDFDAPPRPKAVQEEEPEVLEPEEPEILEPVEPEEPPEPTFTESEMMARIEDARAAAFEEGRRAGSEEAWSEAHAQIEQSVTKALTVIGQQLQNIYSMVDERAAASYTDSIAISVSMMQKMLPELARRHAAAEVEALVTDALTRLVDQPKITVFVHDSVADAVSECLGPVVEGLGYEGRLILQVDDHMEPSDAAIEWGGGGSERDTKRIWAEIERILRTYFGDSALMQPPEGQDFNLAEPASESYQEAPEAQQPGGGAEDALGQIADEDSYRRTGDFDSGNYDVDDEGDDAYLLPDERPS